jgi:hypothetical protein
MTLPPRNAHQRTGMQKLRIVRLGSGGRSLTRPFRAARRFLSLSLSRSFPSKRTPRKFGMSSFKEHFGPWQLWHR